MKEETLNKIVEDINDALWHLKNDKCNVDTKEKGWDTYYGLDIELIDYIRKIEKENKELQQRIEKAIEFIKEHNVFSFKEDDHDWYDYINKSQANDLLNLLEGKDE